MISFLLRRVAALSARIILAPCMGLAGPRQTLRPNRHDGASHWSPHITIVCANTQHLACLVVTWVWFVELGLGLQCMHVICRNRDVGDFFSALVHCRPAWSPTPPLIHDHFSLLSRVLPKKKTFLNCATIFDSSQNLYNCKALT